MNYNKGTGIQENWIVEEDMFDERYLGKCEAIFCQGNGYMGVRSALEEEYVKETRNMLVNGTFDRFHESEVTELPNLPDITKFIIFIDGKRFSLSYGKILAYSRSINLKTGEVKRIVTWEYEESKVIEFTFKRFVSMGNEHIIGSKIGIKSLNSDIKIKIYSGIDGKVSNSGSQHFTEGKRRLYDNTFLQMVSETIESKVNVSVHTAHKFFIDQEEFTPSMIPVIDRREIKISAELSVKKGSTLLVEKISTVHTTRDLEENDNLIERSFQEMKEAFHIGYNKLFSNSKEKWENIWRKEDVIIKSQDSFDQLSIRFAIYHLNIMVKKEDNRVGIGAKALTGEGYKGHSFWDTEIFILPYYIMVKPKAARKLLEYRYKNLYGARKKAKENGYEGAMYPWESAWIDDGEVTPLWGAADVVTGETLKILTGIIEQHITADISYAIWQYYNVTGDRDFMNQYGYEIIFDTARFWISRFEWNETKNQYEINDVIGPDEYKEHVNNNAYTNYLSYFNIKLASDLMNILKISEDKEEKGIYNKLNGLLSLEKLEEDIAEKMGKLYLPLPSKETDIIPQFDGYEKLKYVNLEKYKKSELVGTIYNDFNVEQINELQVSKQADLVVLFFLMEDLFQKKIKHKNYVFYEKRTLHDSSLSKSTHSIVANDLGLYEEAYGLFQGSTQIDLGNKMCSSDMGIHSASMGGIWQAIVLGFGGIRMINNTMCIDSKLPDSWSGLVFTIVYQNSELKISITKEEVTINNNGNEVNIKIYDEMVKLESNGTVTRKIEKITDDF